MDPWKITYEASLEFRQISKTSQIRNPQNALVENANADLDRIAKTSRKNPPIIIPWIYQEYNEKFVKSLEIIHRRYPLEAD